VNLWIHRRNSKLRPGPNDAVKSCGHEQANHFFFNANDPISGLRWLALCRSCFIQNAHQPEIAIRETEAA